MIQVLHPTRWQELEDIFEKNWDTQLPTMGQADIITDVDSGGNIRSFVVCEHLMRIGQIHGDGHYPRAMMRWIVDHMPNNTSAIIIAEQPRFERICQHLGMYPMEGNVYRRDF